jgi:hypothetical protein
LESDHKGGAEPESKTFRKAATSNDLRFIDFGYTRKSTRKVMFLDLF